MLTANVSGPVIKHTQWPKESSSSFSLHARESQFRARILYIYRIYNNAPNRSRQIRADVSGINLTDQIMTIIIIIKRNEIIVKR